MTTDRDQSTEADTWWSGMRWRIALEIVGRAMWIAPAAPHEIVGASINVHGLLNAKKHGSVATLMREPTMPPDQSTSGWQVEAGFFRATYPHRVAPECSCEIGSTCQHRPCCYYGETVPENVRSVLGCRN